MTTTKVELKVSYPPYFRAKDSIEKIMYTVALALLPAAATSIYFFGLRALWLTLICVLSCVLFEWLINLMRHQTRTCFDGSAIVTGILLALNVPVSLPLWMAIAGAFIAIVITKGLFGGLGYNPFNPALVARVFLLISFPVAMTNWPVPFSVDMETAASPRGLLKTEGPAAIANLDLWRAFWGEITGSIGETSGLAILIGALILLLKRYITPVIPLTFIGSTFAFTGIFYLINPDKYASPLFHMTTGGLMLGAFFMATDMVTSPIARRGQIIFAIGCGLLTGVIRLFGGYPEGVSFAILIMNAFVPLLDRWDLAGKSRRLEVKEA